MVFADKRSPTWMWEELGLDGERDAPTFRKQAPILGHESIFHDLPDLRALGLDLAESIRGAQSPEGLTRVVSEDDLTGDLGTQRFARSLLDPKLALSLATMIANFELHLRKVFWVGESLSWLLGATRLDVTGDAIRPPFRSLALVFTDRYTRSASPNGWTRAYHQGTGSVACSRCSPSTSP